MLVVTASADFILAPSKTVRRLMRELDGVGLGLVIGFMAEAIDWGLQARDGDHGRGDHQGALPFAIRAVDLHALAGAGFGRDGD